MQQGPGLQLVGAERRVVLFLVYGFVAVLGTVCFVVGLVPDALIAIVLAEAVTLAWRPQPNLGDATYAPPAPDRWQSPITALRWIGLLKGFWSAGVGFFYVGIFLAIVAVLVVLARPHFGPANYAVLVLFGVWLGTRPLWIGPLRKALKVEASRRFGRYLPTLAVGVEGVDVYLRPLTIAAPQRIFRFSVGFAELDEVRTLDGLSAQGYWQSMAQMDPTLDARSTWELLQLLSGREYRPSIFGMLGLGTHVLMRSATKLYLIGNADESGPAAVAAFQAWRAAHQVPAPTR